MTSKDLTVRIVGDTSKLSKSFTDIGRGTDSMSRKLSSAGSKMSTHVTLPILAAGTAMVAFAADAEETANKVSVTFGKSGGQILKWSKKSIDTMGLAAQTAQDMASQFGLLFSAAKLPGAEVVSLSKDFTQLAADMSSLFNVPAEEALLALRSGLTGEAEPLRRFGVFLNEAAVQAEAARLGIGKMGAELTEQQKVQVRASLIQKSLTKANGDYARTADSVSNQARATKERFKELGAELGKELLPLANSLLKTVTGWIEKFRKLDPEQKRSILKVLGLTAAIGPLLKVVGTLGTGIGGLSRGFGSLGKTLKLSNAAMGVWGLAAGLVVTAGVKVHGMLGQAKEQGEKWADSLKSGEHSLSDYRSELKKLEGGHGHLVNWVTGNQQAYDALHTAVKSYNTAYDKAVGTIIKGTETEKRWGEALRTSSGHTVSQKAKLATLLKLQSDYNVPLSKSAEFTLRWAIQTGQTEQAIGILRRALQPAMGAMKNMLSYTQKNAEAMADWEQHTRRQAYYLSTLDKGGSKGPPPSVPQGNKPGLQHGGSVTQMRSYTVGEAGAETFRPRGLSGTIIPHQGSGGGNTYVNVVVHGTVVAERDLIDAIHKGLLKKQARNGGRLGFAA